jgi:glyoxylase-like metal-dependent hydrolase (beta-lactamase superfamily II)
VLDYDTKASATTKTTNADLIVDYVLAQNFKVQWILETHVHADHMTAAQYLKSKLGGTIAISQSLLEISIYTRNIFGYL